ncbi:uncharacterized protein LOC111703194 [Eurytemora carolleeae]|uniref:uncharacterized protein LOC111703194 n=1 Tax=Eurytemora carolleeae TaxID=1294199 RepID=UPI000C7889EB|nr:uncharacterized protein LOC111703194 [Eurytemora carolleeae]|eukprot:XP_023330841.1 uncharacterized protein LOC111703194 [Eurytemora affinis]
MAENREEKVGEESEKEEEYIIEDEFKLNKSAMKKENFVKTLSNRRVSFSSDPPMEFSEKKNGEKKKAKKSKKPKISSRLSDSALLRPMRTKGQLSCNKAVFQEEEVSFDEERRLKEKELLDQKLNCLKIVQIRRNSTIN